MCYPPVCVGADVMPAYQYVWPLLMQVPQGIKDVSDEEPMPLQGSPMAKAVTTQAQSMARRRVVRGVGRVFKWSPAQRIASCTPTSSA